MELGDAGMGAGQGLAGGGVSQIVIVWLGWSCRGPSPWSLSLRCLELVERSKGVGGCRRVGGTKAEVTSGFVSMFRQARHIAGSTNLGVGML